MSIKTANDFIFILNANTMFIRKILLVALALPMCVDVVAQHRSFSIIPKAGMSATNVIDESHVFLDYAFTKKRLMEDDLPVVISQPDLSNEAYATLLLEDAKYRIGYEGGVDFQWRRNERWAFVAGIGYSLQGCKFGTDAYNPAPKVGQNTWDVKDVQIDLHYLNVPALAKLYVGHGFAMNFGLQVGWLFKANFKSHLGYSFANSSEYFVFFVNDDRLENVEAGKLYERDVKCTIKDRFTPVDISLPLGFSYEYGHYVADARVNIGLMDISDTYTISYSSYDATMRNIGFTMSVGYRFDFEQ